MQGTYGDTQAGNNTQNGAQPIISFSEARPDPHALNITLVNLSIPADYTGNMSLEKKYNLKGNEVAESQDEGPFVLPRCRLCVTSPGEDSL